MDLSWTQWLWAFAIACIIGLPIVLGYAPRKGTASPEKPFPFLALPRELRDSVYEQMLDRNPVFPVRREPAKPTSPWVWLKAQRTDPSKCNWIILANKQINKEYSEMLCKKANFTLVVDELNYKSPKLWSIPHETLERVRKCDVRIITTSSMLGAADPRQMPKSWDIEQKVTNALQHLEKVQRLNLHVRAIGDPMWNPLWVWFHASQCFKITAGAKFDNITFSLDSWSPGENQLTRSKEGTWEWRCPNGHFVATDPDRWQTIREFCGSIYGTCHICRPHEGEDSED